MKRLTVALILIVVGMLVVVAPASAATLHGQWTGGVASGSGGSYPEWGLEWGTSETLGASGNVTIAMYPTYTDVASRMVITAGEGVPPFPVKWNLQSFFAWGPAVWTADGSTCTVNGLISYQPFVKPFPELQFKTTLVANVESGDLALRIVTDGSGWGWYYWDIFGKLR